MRAMVDFDTPEAQAHAMSLEGVDTEEMDGFGSCECGS